MRQKVLIGLACLALLAMSHRAQAWSFKEHILVTRLAVQRLLDNPQTPPEMKAWLREISPLAGNLDSARGLLVEQHIGADPQGLQKLDYWVIFPDIARKVDGEKAVAPFGVPEPPMHFVDLELLLPGSDVKRYRHDLSNKPRIEDLPRDWRDPRLVQAGYLPWRLEQVYGELVKAFCDGRLTPAAEGDRQNALVFAGYLAHYLADNTQPHHSTIDFRSRDYFAIPQRAPDVHGMFEYGMVDWDKRSFPELRGRLFDLLVANLQSESLRAEAADVLGDKGRIDPWTSTVQITMRSYDYLPLIGEAAQIASAQQVREGDPTRPFDPPGRAPDEFDIEAFFAHRGTVNGEEVTLLDVKARQLALAVLRIEAMLRQAWQEAHQKAP